MTNPRTPLDVALDEERASAHGIGRVVADLPSPARVEACLGGTLVWHEPGSPWNGARGLGLGVPVEADELDRLVHFFDERGWGGEVDVCAYADPGLARGLAARGFTPQQFEVAYVRTLDGHGVRGPALAQGLTIEPLDLEDAQRCAAYTTALGRGFALDGDPAQVEAFLAGGLREVMLRSLREPGAQAFVALEGERVVGAASVHVRGASAALSGAATLPEWRRRGVQGALLSVRLEHAREQGARQAVVKTLPGNATERNALRLGFQPSYSVLQMARPGPSAEL